VEERGHADDAAEIDVVGAGRQAAFDPAVEARDRSREFRAGLEANPVVLDEPILWR
jgi:hypothetical protein